MVKKIVDYDELLREATERIKVEYGSVANFSKVKEIRTHKGVLNPKYVRSYLSVPKSGQKKVRSLRFMRIIYRTLWGSELRVTTTRETRTTIEII